MLSSRRDRQERTQNERNKKESTGTITTITESSEPRRAAQQKFHAGAELTSFTVHAASKRHAGLTKDILLTPLPTIAVEFK